MNDVLVAPSILSADFGKLGEEVRLVQDAGADWIHVDVMDGHFVPNISVGVPIVKSLTKCTNLPLDVHLMIAEPLRYAKAFANAGAWGLTFHYEAVDYPEVVIEEYQKLKVKPGMSIKPRTPALVAFPHLKDLNVILIMTVEPGFGGQSFMADMIPKIKEISEYIQKNNLSCKVEVDGGIDSQTGERVVSAGANVLVAGSAIFGSPNPSDALRALKTLGQSAASPQ